MDKTSLSQAPSPTRKPRGYLVFQLKLFDEKGDDGVPSLDSSLRIIGDYLDSVRDGFGVFCESYKVVISGERVALVVSLAAGEWVTTRTTTTKLMFGWEQRLCSQILRFIIRHHEKLG